MRENIGNLQVLKLITGLILQQIPVIVCTRLPILRETFPSCCSIEFPRHYTAVAVGARVAGSQWVRQSRLWLET